jgi:hypothetical protein
MQWLKTKTIEQALADSDEPGRQLQRTLGVFDLMILAWPWPWARGFSRWALARPAALPGRP